MSKDCDPLLLALHFLTREVRELRLAIVADHPGQTSSLSVTDQHLLDGLACEAQAIAKRTRALASGSHQPNCPCGHNERPNMPTSPVQDFVAKVQANFDKTNADLDVIKKEIADLNALVQSLQNGTGTLGPEDQAALDDIAAKSASLAARADTMVPATLPPPPPVP